MFPHLIGQLLKKPLVRKYAAGAVANSPRIGAWGVAAGLGLFIYLAFVGTLPTTIIMWQRFDEGLFMRLGMQVANGNWLGPYNELTLIKMPMYPLFLAANSFTGIPINITQFAIYYLAALYLAIALSRLTQSSLFGVVVLALLLINPSLYQADLRRILRTIFHLAAMYALFGAWIRLFLLERDSRTPHILAIFSGLSLAVVWLSREEAFVLVSSLGLIVIGGLLSPANGLPPSQRTRTTVAKLGLAFAACASIYAILITLNYVHYRRATVLEMTDGAFQSAMVALQKAGGIYERSHVPVPRQAREALYAVSPAFTKLKPYLDPDDGRSPFAVDQICAQYPTSCGDIAGGWFMWALRDAAAQAGMHNSARVAAQYYRTLAAEIERACAMRRVQCLPWVPPLIPPISVNSWSELPLILKQGLGLLYYTSRPWLGWKPESNLQSPDGPAAYAFLNRPPLDSEPLSDTKSRSSLRSVWLWLVAGSFPFLQGVIVLGSVAFVASIPLWRSKLIREGLAWVLVTFFFVIAIEIFVLALVHISSFPAMYHQRTVIAESFVLLAALISCRMAYVPISGFVWARCRTDDQ
jgi:hypothetical protein